MRAPQPHSAAWVSLTVSPLELVKLLQPLSSLCQDLTPGGFLVAQMVKSLLAMWETWVQSLNREDPLEKDKATHSSFLAWKIPWMEGYIVHQVAESDTTKQLHFAKT